MCLYATEYVSKNTKANERKLNVTPEERSFFIREVVAAVTNRRYVLTRDIFNAHEFFSHANKVT